MGHSNRGAALHVDPKLRISGSSPIQRVYKTHRKTNPLTRCGDPQETQAASSGSPPVFSKECKLVVSLCQGLHVALGYIPRPLKYDMVVSFEAHAYTTRLHAFGDGRIRLPQPASHGLMRFLVSPSCTAGPSWAKGISQLLALQRR